MYNRGRSDQPEIRRYPVPKLDKETLLTARVREVVKSSVSQWSELHATPCELPLRERATTVVR